MPCPLHVLLIEDDANDAELLLRQLRRGGYEPMARRVETPAALQQALQEDIWHIVLADWYLPEFSALFAIEMLKSQGFDLPFIIISGLVDEEAVASAIKAGAHDFVHKQHLERLVFTVDRELRESDDRRARRKAEAALAASEERLQLVARATNDAVRDWDLSTNGMWWNEGFSSLCGSPAEEIELGVESWYSRLHPEDKDRVIANVYAAINGGATGCSESYRFRRVDGSYAEVLDRSYIVRNIRGQALRLIGAMTDLTAIRRAHMALQESEARVQAVLAAALDAIIGMDERGMILDWNPCAETMFGRRRDEALGLPLVETILPADQWAVYTSGLRQYMETGEWPLLNRRLETVARRRNGEEFPVEVSVVPLKEGFAHHFYWFIVDISERRAAEMKLHQTEEQLRQSQKMEAVGQLAGGVAHDFNNLLTVIRGYVDLLKSNLPPGASALDDLKEIGNAAERATWLTRQLLAFSRRQILAPQVLDLNVLIGNFEKILSRLIGEDIVLKTQLTAGLALIQADPGQIEQIIMNLAVNARDAMPTGGRLTIETETVFLNESLPDTSLVVPSGRYVLLAVSDTGCGMDAETQKRIFEPFFTTKEIGKGTGLGLSTVYGIVKQSGGFIWVDSEQGEGTTFKVYLPVVDGGVDMAVSKPEPRFLQPRIGVETILLVEDAPTLRVLTKKILELSGYTVLAASHMDEALTLAEARQWAIHLLLTDVIMPDGSGPDIAERLTERCPELRVLYMSGYLGTAMAHQTILKSGAPLLQKPFSPDLLRQKVREVLDEP